MQLSSKLRGQVIKGTSVEGVSMTERAGDAGREGVPSLTGVEVPELYLIVLAVLSSGVIPLGSREGEDIPNSASIC